MTPESAYDRAKAVVGTMYGVGADLEATWQAVDRVADALLEAAKAERAKWVAVAKAVDAAGYDHQAFEILHKMGATAE